MTFEVIKYQRSVGVGNSKEESILDACRHDPILMEEVSILIERLGYKLVETPENEIEFVGGIPTQFESF